MRFFGNGKILGRAMRTASVSLVFIFIVVSMILCITAYGAGDTSAQDKPSASAAETTAAVEMVSPEPSSAPSQSAITSASSVLAFTIKDKYMIGDVAQVSDTLVQVTGFKVLKGKKYEKPARGYEFVIATVVIKNMGTDNIEYSKYDFNMTDSKGGAAEHRMLFANKDTALYSGKLMPGGIVTGSIAFEEPKNDHGLTMIFAPSRLGGRSASFDMYQSCSGFDTLKKGNVLISGQINYIGGTVMAGEAEITVESYSKSAGKYDKPRAGYEYVTVNVKIKNPSLKSIDYNPYYFTAMNSFGQVTDAIITSVDSGTALSSGKLAAGEEAEGTIVFEEPKGDTGLWLIYEDTAGGSGVKLLFPL